MEKDHDSDSISKREIDTSFFRNYFVISNRRLLRCEGPTQDQDSPPRFGALLVL